MPRNYRKSTKRASNNVKRNELRIRLNGHVTRVSPDPPRFTSIPWYPMTLDTTVKLDASNNTKVFDGTDVLKIFTAQCGIGVSIFVNFRFRGIQVWAIGDSPIVLDIWDLFTNNAFLAQVEDDPGKNHWAACGYRYPEAQSKVCITSTSDQNVATVTTGDGGTFKIRFHVLWKFNYANIPTRRLAADEPPLSEFEQLKL